MTLILLKVDMLTNGDPVPELSFVCHASRARERGKKLVARMKDEIPRQQVTDRGRQQHKKLWQSL